MSLNACTINKCPIDTFCRDRRQVVLDRLIEIAHSGHGSGGAAQAELGSAIPNFQPQGYDHVRWRDDLWGNDDKQIGASAVVSVTVSFLGSDGTETQNSHQHEDFVSITNFIINGEDQISVQISNLNI